MESIFTLEDFMKNYALITIDDIKKDYKGLSYVSWAKAWRLATEQDPNCSYEIIPKFDNEGVEHLIWDEADGSCLVRTEFTFKGKTLPMQLSIMDNSHKAVKKEQLTSNLISNSIMRCLTKNIALFGIGLSVYEGEDIPDESEEMSEITKKRRESKKTPQQKLTDLCKQKIAEGTVREKIVTILTKYQEKGLINKMSADDAKKAYKEIEGVK